MLILQTLVLGPAHGHAIERGSEDVLQVEHGSLYPALHCLMKPGLDRRVLEDFRQHPEGPYRLPPEP